MFEEKAAMFIYCTSPVHMGAGTAIGAIDNPIQRERHTGHPNMAGSGLKGALRHEATSLWGKDGLVPVLFGPDVQSGKASDHAGAISLSDAQLVLFPVRSLRQSFVYATCPTALARLQRLCGAAGVSDLEFGKVPSVQDNKYILVDDKLLVSPEKKEKKESKKSLILEAFQFHPKNGSEDEQRAVKTVANWLGNNALPANHELKYFKDKVRDHTVVLSDDHFNYFVRNATIVEPHVRISDETGTAEDQGLFYTENLPPESLLVSLAMASRRWKKVDANGTGEANAGLGKGTAAEMMETLVSGPGGKDGFHGRLLQVGGDSTTGRGQVILSFAGANLDAKEAENV